MTEDERQEARIRDIKNQVQDLLQDGGDYLIRFGDGTIMPLNDIDNYKTEYSEVKSVSYSGYVDGQPAIGYKFTNVSVGGIWVVTNAGTARSLDVTFTKPIYNFKISVKFGFASEENNGGIFMGVPDFEHHFKAKITKTYEVQSYIIYTKVFNDYGGYTWEKWSGGNHQTLLATDGEFVQMD